MRVAFDARVLDRPELAERGIGRYARCLLDALPGADRDLVEVRGLARPPMPARIAELAEHVLLARDVRRTGATVLHSPSIDFATTRPGVPYVVTVHDLVPLKHPDQYLRTGLKHRLRYAAAKRATRVIAPTRAVARDCQALLGIDRGRIAVVPEAPAPGFRPVPDPAPLLSRFNLPDQFVLWVGGLDPPDPRKGVAELTAAIKRRSGPPLVLAGRVSPAAADLAAPGRVLLTGRVTDEELAALYTAADALVLPSEEEGFGLTAEEALACGTPVAAFAIDVMRELHADNPAVHLVEPGDTDSLLDAAEAVAETLVAGPVRSWQDVADATWAVYAAAASDCPSSAA
jgi:glycosyltransferase involved in cell wall biosynthesis